MKSRPEDLQRDMATAARTIDQVAMIVGPYLLKPTSFFVDTQLATDLTIMTAGDMMIASRVRGPGYFDRYRYDFTIRSHRDTGAKTELTKILENYVDWMFYGHLDRREFIHFWWLIDMNSFRYAYQNNGADDIDLKISRKNNGDGTFFLAFDLRSFPADPPILVSSSHPLPAGMPPARRPTFYRVGPSQLELQLGAA